MKTKSFKYWKSQEIDTIFNLSNLKNLPLLDNWLDNKITPSDQENLKIKELQKIISDLDVNLLTEIELIMKIIGPILNIVKLKGQGYDYFAGRQIGATIGNFKLNGFVDGVIASGRYEPIAPYFFLHEYKKEQGFEADPRGQLLAEMLAAQAINSNGKPIYGCYVIGRNWFFCVLSGKEYSFSLAYDCTKPEIFDIFRILKGFKHILETEILI